jgi:GNAT superfamily N-acetyltransferase
MLIERLSTRHDRAKFDCDVESMNAYLRRFARQNDDKGISRTFVAVESAETTRIWGYYTLSTGAVAFEQMPERQLPQYPVPTVLLARLAVDVDAQGQGLGRLMLGDALNRVRRVAQDVGVFAIEVVALSDEARNFYIKRGFAPLRDDPLHLYLTLQTLLKAGEGS